MMMRRPQCGRRDQDEAARLSFAHAEAVPFFHPEGGLPKLWLFDMDDTLLASSAGIRDEVHELMNAYLIGRLGMSEVEANRLRELYWRECGSTFIGLWRHHGVDPRDFLPAVHDFDYGPYIEGLPNIRRLLARFPGRRALLTNGPESYVSRILPALGLGGFFDAVVTSTDMRLFGDWRPKPSVPMLLAVCARMGVRPGEAALVDDGLINLRAAKRAGLRTVWCVGLRMRHAGLRPPFGTPMAHAAADLVVRDVRELSRCIERLRRTS